MMDEIDLDVFNQRLSLRNEDAETMEMKLKALLLQNPYTLEEEDTDEEEIRTEGEGELGFEGEEEMGYEGGQPSGLYQWNDLKRMLHASDEELKSALRLVSAVEIKGYWRIVDELCISRVLYSLVWKAKSMHWSLSSLDGDKVVRSLGRSRVLIQHCLELFASTTDGRVWELDTKRVCVELARWMIKRNGKRMEFQKFMDHWSYLGLPRSLDMLEGEVLVEKHGNQAWVHLSSDRNGPNGNTYTSVSQAFLPDLQNSSRLSLRNDDAGTMEQKLKTLLLQNPYTMDEELGVEPGQPSCLYKWDDLKIMLHATDEELKSALRLVSAVEINGYWRIVDDLCIDQVLYWIVQETTAGYGCFNPVDGNMIVKDLGDRWGFSPVLVRHCLELYASTTDGSVWELDAKRVCVEIARWIIKWNENRMEIQNFMDLWSCLANLEWPVSLDMLEGVIQVEKDGDQSWVSLPSDDNALVSVSQEMH